MAYVTLSDLKGFLGVNDTEDDVVLTLALNAALQHIDRLANRTFNSAVDTRTFQASNDSLLFPGDLVSITTLATDNNDDGAFEVTWAPSDYQLERANSTRPYTTVRAIGTRRFPVYWTQRQAVQITGTFGWPAVPDDIKYATLILASRLYKRKDSPEGVLGFGDMGAVRLTPQDRDVMALVGRYRRQVVA